jgi:hypothetical protein
MSLKSDFSLAPGFSRVFDAVDGHSAVSTASACTAGKPLKRLCALRFSYTGLKPGANEMERHEREFENTP